MRRWVALLALLAGCLGPATPDPTGEGGDVPATDPTFSTPVRVNARDEGFEPSLRIAPDGTVYVAAARGFLAGAEGELASPVWWSDDEGATWTPLATPLAARDRAKGIEGDLAVDATGAVYFLDTSAVDDVLTVWGPDRQMRSMRVLGSLALDDRPWLAAHGDGVLYAMGNAIATMPAPETPQSPTRWWLYRSTDGGASWTLGQGFDGGYCHVAASPADDRTVAVACIGPGFPRMPTTDSSPAVTVHQSTDQGRSWQATTLPSSPRDPANDFPAVAFGPAGHAVVAWMEADGTVAASVAAPAGAWGPLPPIAAAGPARSPWPAMGPEGRTALAAFVQGDQGWRLDAWAWDGTVWRHDVADPGPLGEADAPEDFFQAAYDAEGRLHVAYHDAAPVGGGPLAAVDVKPFLQPVLHARHTVALPGPV